MKVQTFENESDWLDARRGRITGTTDFMDKRGGDHKKGFWEVVAGRVAVPPSSENVMERGHRLEVEAITRFEKETGKKVDSSLVMWERDDNEYIAISPDGQIGETEAVEVKCLDSALHIEAYFTKDYPKCSTLYSTYKRQALQYFVVNNNLDTLYTVFYDPRMPVDFFFIETKREGNEDKIREYYEAQLVALAEVQKLEEQLTF